MEKNNYKLIVDLPDLYKGAILVWNEAENCYKCEKSIWVSPNRYAAYSAGTVTQSPEFFEEIKQTYPINILSFKAINSGTIFHGNDQGLYGLYVPQYTIFDMLKGVNSVEDGCFEIWQVSGQDDKILTIGDTISRINSFNTKLEIVSFSYSSDGINIICIEEGYFNREHTVRLKDIVEYIPPKKEFVFTTTDGHFVFEGDGFYVVNDNLWYLVEHKCGSNPEYGKNVSEFITFKIKEDAEKYCLQQKMRKAYKLYIDLVKEYDDKYGE